MFADILNRLLTEKKINALLLARQIGVPKSIVYEWKNGEREPSVDNMVRLADFFGVSLEYLTGREEIMNADEKELLLLFRSARALSDESQRALLQHFRDNLTAYLRRPKNGAGASHDADDA